MSSVGLAVLEGNLAQESLGGCFWTADHGVWSYLWVGHKFLQGLRLAVPKGRYPKITREGLRTIPSFQAAKGLKQNDALDLGLGKSVPFVLLI